MGRTGFAKYAATSTKTEGLSAKAQSLLAGQTVRLVRYEELPVEYQQAVSVYFDPEEVGIPEHWVFGTATLPMDKLTQSVLTNPDMVEGGFTTFDEYHNWYVRREMPSHSDVWPVVLDTVGDETLEDGWHRLHDYYRQGLQEVPVVWLTE